MWKRSGRKRNVALHAEAFGKESPLGDWAHFKLSYVYYWHQRVVDPAPAASAPEEW
ncbi:MAG: hypothetical protein LBB90_04415 [Tannerella sp.]|nr:hypothetical protein [Tannerella sp.]